MTDEEFDAQFIDWLCEVYDVSREELAGVQRQHDLVRAQRVAAEQNFGAWVQHLVQQFNEEVAKVFQ